MESKRNNDKNFTREMTKTQKLENMWRHTITPVREGHTNHACRSHLVNTTVRDGRTTVRN